MAQFTTEPMSNELYAMLVKSMGVRKANELRDRNYPKSPATYSLSFEARSGLKQIAEQLNFLKGGTYAGSTAKANPSALLEAIGLGYAVIHVLTAEEVADRRNNPELDEYRIVHEHMEDGNDYPDADKSKDRFAETESSPSQFSMLRRSQ